MIDLPTEEWKPVVGYEGLYEVSSLGRVRSRQGLLRQSLANRYPSVHLSRDGKQATHRVHRLVASAFIPNPDGRETVNHIDGDRTNNAALNLEWVTTSENVRHAHHSLGTREYFKHINFGGPGCKGKPFVVHYPDGRSIRYSSGQQFKRTAGASAYNLYLHVVYGRKQGVPVYTIPSGKWVGLRIEFLYNV